MIKGVGLHAGGIDLLPGGPYLEDYLAKVKTLEDGSLIDPLKNLEDAPVFISSGSNDPTVPRVWQEAQRDFYKHFDADVNFTKTKNSHCFPVDRKVSDEWPLRTCELTYPENPSLINCKLDLAGNILKYIYGNLEPQSEFKERTDDWANLGVLRNYDQHELVEGDVVEDGFSDLGGFVYYPNYCVQDGHKCRVHVFIHGCT